MLLQDNVNPSKEERQEREPLQNHEQAGASSPPAGPLLQFGAHTATIPSYTGPALSGTGLQADHFNPLEYNCGTVGIHCCVLGHLGVNAEGDLLDPIVHAPETVSFK